MQPMTATGRPDRAGSIDAPNRRAENEKTSVVPAGQDARRMSFARALSRVLRTAPGPMHDQYSREVVIPGMGTGYLPSGPGCNGAGESSVS